MEYKEETKDKDVQEYRQAMWVKIVRIDIKGNLNAIQIPSAYLPLFPVTFRPENQPTYTYICE
jgi:hypothetical protein